MLLEIVPMVLGELVRGSLLSRLAILGDIDHPRVLLVGFDPLAYGFFVVRDLVG